MFRALFPFLALLHACTTPPPARGDLGPSVRHWGSMREVLREGQTQGRIELARVLGPHTLAVGASAGLAAEITVVGGQAHLAEVDPSTVLGLTLRAPEDGEEATLLVLADVETWSEHALPAVSDLAGLEAAVRTAGTANQIDVTRPFPFRVEGVASALRMHVLNHACPIADPDGPSPWRFAGERERTVLVGFYAQDSEGRLTHHGQRTHVHALLPDRDLAGHLDDVGFPAGARLYLPAR